MAVKKFQAFEYLTAADTNNYLMNQSVMVLPSTTAIGTAGTAIGTATSATIAPAEGMLVYLQDLNQYQMNLDSTASGWYPIAGQMPLAYASQSGTIATTSGNFATITYNSVNIRGGITHNAGVFTLPYAGVYTISSTVNWESGTAGNRSSSIQTSLDNGSTYQERATSRMYLATTSTFYQTNQWTYYLPANTLVRIQCQQNSGSFNATGATWPMNTCITYLGA